MLAQTLKNLANAPRHFTYDCIDIQSIPYGDNCFDAVIANHMLYYVPDKPRALSEVKRVLKPGGRFITSTVGKSHLQEMDQLVGQFFHKETSRSNDEVNSFMLENGLEQLTFFFDEIHLYRYADGLIVDEASPLVAYMLSGRYKTLLEDRRREFLRFIDQKIRTHGAIHINKDSGLFTAVKKDFKG
jgi:SAM-dependent methyltransferase